MFSRDVRLSNIGACEFALEICCWLILFVAVPKLDSSMDIIEHWQGRVGNRRRVGVRRFPEMDSEGLISSSSW